MRGSIIDWRRGAYVISPNPFPFFVGLLNIPFQELTFWLWRVAAIRLECNLAAGASSLVFDRTYYSEIQFGTDPEPRTEYDQLILGRAGFLAEEEPGDPLSFNFQFASSIAKDPASAVQHEGWELSFSFEIAGVYFAGEGSAGTPAGATCEISATDPVLHEGADPEAPFVQYEHLLNFTRTTPTDLTGTARITPVRFHQWKNALGQPLYDELTGEKLPDPALLQ